MAYANAQNMVMISGRFTRDVEAEEVGRGKNAFLKIRNTVAVPKKLTKEQREEYEDDGKPTADFIYVEFTGKVCETIEKYFDKGDGISIIGTLRTYQWEDDDGDTQYGWCVDVVDFGFPPGKSNSDDDDDDDRGSRRSKSKSKSSRNKKSSSRSSKSSSRSSKSKSSRSNSSKSKRRREEEDDDDDYEVEDPDYDDDEDDDDLPF